MAQDTSKSGRASPVGPAWQPTPLLSGADPQSGAEARPPRFGALTAMASLMVVAVLYFGRDIFVPFALAALLGFVLDPLVTRLRRWRLPRPAAVVMVMVCTIAVLGATSLFVGSQIVQLSKDIPTYQSTILNKLRLLRQAHIGRGLWGEASRMIDVVGGELDALDETNRQPAPRATRVQVEPAHRSALQNIADVVNPILEPAATAGLVLVFVVFILLQRNDMRDRLLRLVGGDLHHTTDAVAEAAQRVSRYLTTQLMVNLLGFGLPMAIGLALIGVPGALLWGLLAGVMRFVPYVGLFIAALFPLTMAFAIDPGWSMMLWTVGLILVLEFVIIYLVEPWIYGASTGLSAMSILIAAVFWTALWGPIGLILATPLTVCLAVLGRHLPQLQWLDVLLGSAPVFDPPTRLYQRLLAGAVEEAIEMADEHVARHSLQSFYSEVAVPALRLAAHDHTRVASVEHRHRISTGMGALIRDLRDQHGSTGTPAVSVLCIGGRWEMDTLAADMLAHSLAGQKVGARALPASAVSADHINALELGGVQVVCLSYFSPAPEAHVRYVARRLKRRQPDLRVVVALWNATPAQLAPGVAQTLGVDAVAHSLAEAAMRSQVAVIDPEQAVGPSRAPVPLNEVARLQALADSGVLDPSMRGPLDRAAQRVADIFDTPLAMVSLIDETCQIWHGAAGLDDVDGEATRESPRDASLCGHVVAAEQTMVIEDVARDPRFASHPALHAAGLRFYAGAPLRTADGHVIGSLCVLDAKPRVLTRAEVRLLEAMADDLMSLVAEMTAARRAEATSAAAKAAASSLLNDAPAADAGRPATPALSAA